MTSASPQLCKLLAGLCVQQDSSILCALLPAPSAAPCRVHADASEGEAEGLRGAGFAFQSPPCHCRHSCFKHGACS